MLHDGRRQTRYFIAHAYLFLLIQPDLALPNHGVVVELSPLRDVEVVARTDAKGLALKLGGAGTPSSDVGGFAQGGAHGENNKRVLQLYFEDKKRCSCLYEQVVAARRRVKIEIAGKLQQWILDC